MAAAAVGKSGEIDKYTQWHFPKESRFNFFSNPLEEMESRLASRLSEEYSQLDAKLAPKLAQCLVSRANITYSMIDLDRVIGVWFEETIREPIDEKTKKIWARVMIECSNEKWAQRAESATAAAKK